MIKKKEFKDKKEKELITADNIVLDGELPDRITVNTIHATPQKPQSKWDIDADLNEMQFAEACDLLDSGMKVRRVALRLGIHRNKIKKI